MARSLHKVFQFLAENTDLVMELHHRGQISANELMELIKRSSQPKSPSPSHMRRMIQDLGIIEPGAESDDTFELDDALGQYMSTLTHRQTITSAKIIQGYIHDINHRVEELRYSLDQKDAFAALRELQGTERTVKTIRTLSINNREAIVTQTQELRAGSSGTSRHQRFRNIVHLWKRYMRPLEDLVKANGAMDQSLALLRVEVEKGERVFRGNRDLGPKFSQVLAKIIRLQNDAFECHKSAIQELAPLYNEAARISRWSQGASIALSLIRRHGIDSLKMARSVTGARWKSRHILSDSKIRSRLVILRNYKPEPIREIGRSPEAPRLPVISPAEVLQRLQEIEKIDDILEFVFEAWCDFPLSARTQLFVEIVSGKYGKISLGQPEIKRNYSFHDARITAYRYTMQTNQIRKNKAN